MGHLHRRWMLARSVAANMASIVEKSLVYISPKMRSVVSIQVLDLADIFWASLSNDCGTFRCNIKLYFFFLS